MGRHLAALPPKPRRRFPWLALLCLAAALGGVFLWAQRTKPGWLTTAIGRALLIPPPRDLFNKDRLYVLVLGIDYSYNEKDYETSKGARSDTIMAVALDLNNSTANVVSVLRDTGVVLPNGRESKINQAYSDGGPPEAKRVIANFLGLPGFDRYVIFRVNQTQDLIDAIGGIDVPVTEAMNYDDNWGHLHIHFTPGIHHMNGAQAVAYGRFRHDACSDPCRVKRQQQIIRILLAKLKNDKLNDLAHLNNLIDVINRDVETDLTSQEKLSLGLAFSNLNLRSQTQIPYVGDKDTVYGGNVLVADENMKRTIVQKYLLGPIAPTPPPDATVLAAIAPSSIRVDIENGSGAPGAARKLASQLQNKGFAIGTIGNADSADYRRTEIHVHTTVPYAGEKVRAEVPRVSPTISPDANPTQAAASDVTVIVGRDFAQTVRRRTPAIR